MSRRRWIPSVGPGGEPWHLYGARYLLITADGHAATGEVALETPEAAVKAACWTLISRRLYQGKEPIAFSVIGWRITKPSNNLDPSHREFVRVSRTTDVAGSIMWVKDG